MQYIAITVHCRLTARAFFPSYKGSMLRGALGNQLRRAVCVTHKDDCATCMLQRSCVFPRVFTAFLPQADTHDLTPQLPPPYCLEPPDANTREYDAGASFVFGLKLFAYAVDYLPYFIHAFTLAGKYGMGKQASAGFGTFVIEDVRQGGVSLYDVANERLLTPHVSRIEPPVPCIPSASDTPSQLDVRLCTPLRFKQDNHLSAAIPFSQIFLLTVRRIKSLCALDGLTWQLPKDVFDALMMRACAAQVTTHTLRWLDWSRYSGRQDSKMQLGGMVGDIQFSGPLTPFDAYMQYAQQVHIGKQTSFGLGRIMLL